MKSSLRKLRGFALHKGDLKERREPRPTADADELAQASQDMQDMRNCYDSLLSAAAATANSAYEFSEALHEMGTCLLAKTVLNDDDESGQVLLKLGKAQFELQKLVNSYRVHITQTITTPSESLLKELQIVEEMKRQCDDKREYCKFMLAAHREKGKSRNTKGESVSLQQLQTAQEDYDEEATLFVFRLKSLKQGQSRSLLTQAARHHAAQLSFFRKGVKYLELVEPDVKLVADQQHIDYHFSGLEDDDTEDDDDDDVYGDNGNDDQELSFGYGRNDQGPEVLSTARNSMELDQLESIASRSAAEIAQDNPERSQADFPSRSSQPKTGSQSEPLFPDKKFEPSERIRAMRPSSTRKFHTYVLPTPLDAKSTSLASKSVSAANVESKGGWPTQLWHSTPLDPNKAVGDFAEEKSSPAGLPKAHSVHMQSNVASGAVKMPPPLSEELSLLHFSHFSASDPKKIKRHAFSGPLTSKDWPSQPIFGAADSLPLVDHSVFSAAPAHIMAPPPSVSPKVSPSASPPPMSSPKISELHELPRPPISLVRASRSPNLLGHSAPLVSRGQQLSATSKTPSVSSYMASPLPPPPGVMSRSFSIPSNTQRAPILTIGKLLETPENVSTADVDSPPLTPITVKKMQQASTASASATRAMKDTGFS